MVHTTLTPHKIVSKILATSMVLLVRLTDQTGVQNLDVAVGESRHHCKRTLHGKTHDSEIGDLRHVPMK